MDEKLIIPKCSRPDKAADIPALLDNDGISWNCISAHNWADKYPYKPSAAFRIAHCGDALMLNYRVEETCIRALAERNNGKVWEDSCCELFIQYADDSFYYNIESNCAGSLLIGCGENRYHRELAPITILDNIDRWTSLGSKKKPLEEGLFQWQLALFLPIDTFFRSTLNSFNGLQARCNIYKCGDKLLQPHFLSWMPVNTPQPDFHQPCNFGAASMDE